MTDREIEHINAFRDGLTKAALAFYALATNKNLTANALFGKASTAFDLLNEIEDALMLAKAKALEEEKAKAEEEAWANGF